MIRWALKAAWAAAGPANSDCPNTQCVMAANECNMTYTKYVLPIFLSLSPVGISSTSLDSNKCALQYLVEDLLNSYTSPHAHVQAAAGMNAL